MQRHIETYSVFFLSLVLFQDKLLCVKNLFGVTIFDHDPKWFSSAMITNVPGERCMSF